VTGDKNQECNCEELVTATATAMAALEAMVISCFL